MMELRAEDLNDRSWWIMEQALYHGAIHPVSAKVGLLQKEISIADMLEGDLYLIKWKEDHRALVRTKDEQLAFEAGIEFASNGGHPFHVVDPYDWSDSIYRRTKSGKTVTIEELSTIKLTLEVMSNTLMTIKFR